MCDAVTIFFFFNDTATTEIYTLSLHDALPICGRCGWWRRRPTLGRIVPGRAREDARRNNKAERADRPARSAERDRKSTRLNSSHANISYAVFCLKKKKKSTSHRHS